MDDLTRLHGMEKHGYRLLPRPHRSSPGYGGLLVAIRARPTGEHFDPRTVRLPMCDSQGSVRWRTLSWLTPEADSDRVGLGRVIVTDRMGKSLEFFTFGGSLETAATEGAYLYTLTSPAPILQLAAESETVADQLAAEAEALLARGQLGWPAGETVAGDGPSGLDPLPVYVAVLEAILASCEGDQALHVAYDDLCAALIQEKMWLAAEGHWPAGD